MTTSPTKPPIESSALAERLVAFAVIGILAILIVPMPPMLLDLMLAVNIGVSVLILMVALKLVRPIEFSVFPSMLLVTTLFRLGLNVATTRLILTRGGEGVDAAGQVIAAFGEFAVGGSVIIGLIIFLILVIVNFTVITKGSTRISEVAARFTLDALPGKQMSIDADLAAGIINDKEARSRRSLLEQEAEFFGAMDGASKFVRGDAVAGLIITAINIVGGLAVGVLRDNLSFVQAASTFTVLTIGDGLVSQIPALIISTASGMVITRSGARSKLGAQLKGQILGSPEVMMSAGVVLAAMAILPGMPTLAFMALSGGSIVLGRRAKAAQAAANDPAAKAKAAAEETADEPERLADLLAMDAIELELGYGLLNLIDGAKGGELPSRITALRKQLATELGLILPSVHIKDNLSLESKSYRVMLRGVEIGKGEAYGDRVMALDGQGTAPDIEGIAAVEPAFGLPAMWITAAQRPEAEAKGLTLVDASSVLTTHLSESLRENAHELIGRQETQELLATLSKDAPKLVEDVVPGAVNLGELVGVLRELLREGISIRDLRTILEAVGDASARSKERSYLVERARRRMSRQITAAVADEEGGVKAMTLARGTEEQLRATLGQQEGEPVLAPDVDTARRLIATMERHAAGLAGEGRAAVILSPPDLRRPLFDFASRFVKDLAVVTARELVPGTNLEPAGVLDVG